MLYEKSCGAVVYRKTHGNIEILLIRHLNSGYWSFPKGHVEEGETEIKTAEREVLEETGVQIDANSDFREMITFHPRMDAEKSVVYFVGAAKNFNTLPQEAEIAEVRWTEINMAISMLSYENDRVVLTKARNFITALY